MRRHRQKQIGSAQERQRQSGTAYRSLSKTCDEREAMGKCRMHLILAFRSERCHTRPMIAPHVKFR